MPLRGETQYPGEFALHRKYARSEMLLDLVWTHSYITLQIAERIVSSGRVSPQNVPKEALTHACLLFDIGVYVCDGFEFVPGQTLTGRPYAQHTIAGAWLLKQEGYPASIVQAAYSHASVGFTPQDIANFSLALPPADYSPQTQFLQVVSFSEKFHSKAPKFRTSLQIKDALQRYGTAKVKTFESWLDTFGEPDIAALSEEFKEWHIAMQYKLNQIHQPQGASPLVV